MTASQAWPGHSLGDGKQASKHVCATKLRVKHVVSRTTTYPQAALGQ